MQGSKCKWSKPKKQKNKSSWPFDWEPANVLQYAHAVAGCSVKMLTRDGVSSWENNVTICGDPRPVTSDEIDLAVERLNTGFAFVGILEEWDLSICLLHAKFGGPCASYELEEGHTTSGIQAATAQVCTTPANWVDGPSWQMEGCMMKQTVCLNKIFRNTEFQWRAAAHVLQRHDERNKCNEFC